MTKMYTVDVQANLRVLHIERLKDRWVVWLTPRRATHASNVLYLMDDGTAETQYIDGDTVFIHKLEGMTK